MRSFNNGLFLLLLVGGVAHGQTIITGKVSDKKNPLPGVSITLNDTYDGANSDCTGKYSFKTTEKVEFILVATSSGYKPFEQHVKLEGDKNLTIDILLKEEITELQAVVMSAGTFEASDRKRAARSEERRVGKECRARR